MSFDIILVDTNALSVSKSSSAKEIALATNALGGDAEECDLSNIYGEMKLIVDQLQERYGTLREPKPGCPWAMWPPFVDTNGQRVSLSVGWKAGLDVVKYVEMISSSTSIAVINPQPPERPRKNLNNELDRLLGTIEESGLSVYLKMGSFGPYFQYGGFEEIVHPKRRQLRDDMKFDFESATLANAKEIAALPRIIGRDSKGDDVLSDFGSERPYVKYESKFYGSTSIDPLSITLEEALKIIKDEEIEGYWRAR